MKIGSIHMCYFMVCIITFSLNYVHLVTSVHLHPSPSDGSRPTVAAVPARGHKQADKSRAQVAELTPLRRIEGTQAADTPQGI